MSLIDIVTMRGMVPRVADHLLPDEAATLAQDCHFDRGVLAPLTADKPVGLALPLVPKTLFHYYGAHWFAWNKLVEVMRSPIAQDQYNRIYYTDGEYPKLTYDAIATGGSNKPTAWYRLGVLAPATPPNMQSVTPPVGGKDDNPTDDETRFYVETYVTGLGEEGAPGPASGKVTITIPNSTVLVGLSPAPTNNSNITRRRLYRSVSGGGMADYLLVADLPIATVTHSDSKKDGELGPVLETYGYIMPPDKMRGICQMANGICAGFIGNAVLFSEPFLPYAWPEKYKLTTEHDIVAIAAIDTALVVGTKGYPYLFQGASPSAITGQKLSSVQQACVSARSMVALDGMVLYAAPDGLIGVGADGGTLITEGIITREQWQVMKPDTLRAWYSEGKYVALTDSHGFVFDPKSGDLRWLSSRWDTAVPDMQLDALMLAKGIELYHWRGGATPLPMIWRSKEFELPLGVRLGCARVTSDLISQCRFTLIIDGARVFSLTEGQVPDGVFRLPPLRGRRWQVEVAGTAVIERITLGSSIAEVAAQ
ncbi:hypothetical protein HMPREF1170_02631 [Aeromonas veronii AMC35]|uniref:hypothetical protein n=1 Tax=Aeromonas veronii TaxID=654 RepID=UPI0002806914|nr:hypothetical protein [Aeromonas veronii]EKB22369.1 hypothetical protein HMPREF1170_02631 [Aeromonas veronii AMC35]